MLDDRVLERGDLAPHELESPEFASPEFESVESVPAFARERELQPRTREATPRDSSLSDEGQPEPTKQPRRGFLRRRPIVSAIGAVLLASVLGGGYLYVDYAGRFQSTDDAFIAARQSSLAPKVSGYITAVPVTDNEHVAAGDVIVRIDDRDYRIALDQAQAQVAAAQASVENIDAQLNVQQAQISANEAQVEQAQAAHAQFGAVRFRLESAIATAVPGSAGPGG